MDEVVQNIRSALISTKGKSDLKTLEKDYRMIIGKGIPYREFGFRSVEDFIKSIPTLSWSRGPNGQLLVDAVPTPMQQNIVGMINKQKPPKQKFRQGISRYQIKSVLPRAKSWHPAAPARAPHRHVVAERAPRFAFAAAAAAAAASASATSTAESLRNKAAVARKANAHEFDKLRPTSLPSRLVQNSAHSLKITVTNNNDLGSLQGVTRSRMRTPDTQPVINFQNATATPAVRFTTPTLTQAQIEALLKEDAIAKYDPESPIWRWSSSSESSKADDKSVNSSPVVATTAAKSPTATTATTTLQGLSNGALKELVTFTRLHNLPDATMKITNRGRSLKLYDCHIRVEDRSYSSYPSDCETAADAEKAAVRQALADLEQRYTKRSRFLVATESDVLERVPPIIEKHFHGVWDKQVAQDYEERYKEQLPANWLALLDTLPNISVEPTLDNRFVLKSCCVGEKVGEKTLQRKKSVGEPSEVEIDVSIPLNTCEADLKGVKRFEVQIMCALSTVEVWCRRVETPEALRYEDMLEQLVAYFETGLGEHAVHVSVGRSYVVRYDDYWCRVSAVQVHEHEVVCFFVDYGDECVVQRSDIYVIPPAFAQEPAQAFVCQLAGMQPLANITCATEYLERLNDRIFIATSQPDTDAIQQGIEITLEDEVNINEQLISWITSDSVDNELDVNQIKRVHVTHVTDKGDVFVQVESEGCSKVNELLANLSADAVATQVPVLPADYGSVLLHLDPQTDKWCRCMILDRAPNGAYAYILYIDSGQKKIVSLLNLYPLHDISPVLAAFPSLAIRISLGVRPIPVNFTARIQPLSLTKAEVLLKVIRFDELVNENAEIEGKVPVCELFQRREPSNGLFSVNAALFHWTDSNAGDANFAQANATSTTDRTQQLTKKLERLKSVSSTESVEDGTSKSVPSTGILKAPDLPAINEYLDVRVPFAVSPWNFFVQPYASANALEQLMAAIQQRYGAGQEGRAISMEDVVPGRIYASRREDGLWYRTSVIKVIHAGSISVFYCDFGCYANLTVKQLVQLDERFLTLPFQAIKARLAEIRPKNVKWTMDDCQYFEQLVSKKKFVSVLLNIQNDELYKYDKVLSLRLIDTSTPKDLRIDQLLIEQGIAIH